MSIRPEDLRLFETPPADTNHTVIEGIVSAKVFLGECIDFKIMANETELLARSHPSVRTHVGEKIYMTIDPLKCAILSDTPARSASLQ